MESECPSRFPLRAPKEYVQIQDLDAEDTEMEAKALDSTTFQYGHLPAVISLLLPNLFPFLVSELQNYTTK